MFQSIKVFKCYTHGNAGTHVYMSLQCGILLDFQIGFNSHLLANLT